MISRRAARASIVLASLVFPAYWLSAQDKPKQVSNASESREPAPVECQKERTPPLEKTVRLEFKLVNPEEEPTFPITCATREFEISHDVSEPNFEHRLQIAGTILPLKPQGRLLLTFKATNHHADFNEGLNATFTAKGSAILEIGKQKTLGALATAR